jgi:molybdopterin converting factor small subunit
MATIIIPFPFRKHTDSQREVSATGETLAENLDNLLSLHSGLQVIHDQPGLLSIFINGKNVTVASSEWKDVAISESDEITLIIPIAGG